MNESLSLPQLAQIRDNIGHEQLNEAVARAQAALLRRQKPDGHWVFELEADATIPAEYVLLEHFLDRIDTDLERRIANYLRSIQGDHGGWPLFHDGKFDLSASVKAYFALKIIGDDPGAPHMVRAREAIVAAGGAERTNVFTRAQLALYGEVPWRAVPVMPVEIMHLPKWFPFHLSKVSYWSRTVTVPLLVLMTLRPKARNPRGVRIQELFRTPPEQVADWIRGPYRSAWGNIFRHIDNGLRVATPLFPAALRKKAIDKAVAFVIARLNGEDGLGGIYPAMANAAMMFDTLGYSADHPHPAIVWVAVRKLLVVDGEKAYCQPCLSPVWDTGLAGHAVVEADGSADGVGHRAAAAAGEWLRGKQVLDVVGDWADSRPDAVPGGWAFQYENPHYPDVDDTAVVAMLLHRQTETGAVDANDPHTAVTPVDEAANAEAIARARDWVIAMQGRDGGWGAFDADNDKFYLNHIPFADHGALLDPSTADVTARCISFLAQIGLASDDPGLARGVKWLRDNQEKDGSWFGRWGTNYIYGTWSVLCALNAAGIPHDDPAIRNAVAFLLATQRGDGGWGEDNETYAGTSPGLYHRSNPSQTAWALLGLMAAGEVEHQAVADGVAYLAGCQKPDGEWDEEPYTAVGFPRVFYLRYHGYRLFFPLLAIARYRNLMRGNDRRVSWGF
jgi:squalene-hopene/tetraprenyl-beta-curcumene cyclase